MRMRIFYRRKSLSITTRKVSPIGKIRGLMFRSRHCENLLFVFACGGRPAIHSWFVFFPFLALWLDDDNRVQERKVVYPFTSIVVPKHHSHTLVEIPYNARNEKIIRFFVGKGKV